MREKVVKTRGRKPKTKTVEKRVEKLLAEGAPAKRKQGRPAQTYDDRPDHIKFIIDSAALGYSPTHIVNLLKARYGETAQEVVTISTIVSYKKRYMHEVAKREKELRAELTSMLPSVRIRHLQRVVERAEEGTPVGVDKDGNVVLRPDHNAVIQAVKELNVMMKDLDAQRGGQQHEIKTQTAIEELKNEIRKHIEQVKGKTGTAELEILTALAQTMQDEEDSNIIEALSQLNAEYTM